MPDRDAERICSSKRYYVCEADALKAAARFADRHNPGTLRAYLCRVCGGWHLTRARSSAG